MQVCPNIPVCPQYISAIIFLFNLLYKQCYKSKSIKSIDLGIQQKHNTPSLTFPTKTYLPLRGCDQHRSVSCRNRQISHTLRMLSCTTCGVWHSNGILKPCEQQPEMVISATAPTLFHHHDSNRETSHREHVYIFTTAHWGGIPPCVPPHPPRPSVHPPHRPINSLGSAASASHYLQSMLN